MHFVKSQSLCKMTKNIFTLFKKKKKKGSFSYCELLVKNVISCIWWVKVAQGGREEEK